MPFAIGEDQPLPDVVEAVIVSLGPGEVRDRAATELADTLVARGAVVAGATHFDALGPRMVVLVSQKLVDRDPTILEGLTVLAEKPRMAFEVVPQGTLDARMRDRVQLVQMF